MYMRRLVKMGNALGVSLPKKYLAELGLKEGCFVEIVKQDGSPQSAILIFPVRMKRP